MLHLTLAGLSEDNKRLLLVSDDGQQFTLALDAKLRAALRGEHARIGQLEIHMNSALRPRDIQARIRAGETPEAVAQAAQTTIEKIMPFANPVLAERAHVAERAQRSSVRRRSGEPGGARALGDAVAETMRGQNVDPETVEWDAWRREDGRWMLTGQYAAGKRRGIGKFTFDMPGNYVTLDNDDARWLVSDSTGRTAAAVHRDDLQQARQRRARASGEDHLPLGDDALDLVGGRASVDAAATGPDDDTTDLTHTVARVRGAQRDDQPDAQVEADPDLAPTPEPLADEPAARHHDHPSRPADRTADRTAGHPSRSVRPELRPEVRPEVAVAGQPAEPAPSGTDDDTAARRPARRKRASVPSWDEIMFGGGNKE